MSEAMRSLPSLDGPPGVMMQGSGGGGSTDMWTSNGQAFTDMPASELRDHFAGQLVAAGCTELGRGGDATTAWGRWKLPQDGYETIVTVVAAMPKVLSKVDCKLLVVGEFYDSIEKYHQLIRRHDLESHVHIDNRYVPNEEVAEIFEGADVLVLPYVSASQSGVVRIALSNRRIT